LRSPKEKGIKLGDLLILVSPLHHEPTTSSQGTRLPSRTLAASAGPFDGEFQETQDVVGSGESVGWPHALFGKQCGKYSFRLQH